jgi:hypothetical protein
MNSARAEEEQRKAAEEKKRRYSMIHFFSMW